MLIIACLGGGVKSALMLKRINTLDSTLADLEEALAAVMKEIRKNTKSRT